MNQTYDEFINRRTKGSKMLENIMVLGGTFDCSGIGYIFLAPPFDDRFLVIGHFIESMDIFYCRNLRLMDGSTVEQMDNVFELNLDPHPGAWFQESDTLLFTAQEEKINDMRTKMGLEVIK